MFVKYLMLCGFIIFAGPFFPQTAMSDEAMDELKRRTSPDAAALQKRLDNLKGLKSDSIGVELYELQELHEISKANWAKLERIRDSANIKDDKEVEKRGIDFATNNWKNVLTRKAKITSANEREAKAYESIYKEPFGPYASKSKEWAQRDEAKAFEVERQKANSEFNLANKANADKVASLHTARDKELDDLQKSLLADFHVTANAVKQAQKALDDQTAIESNKSKLPTETKTTGPVNPPTPAGGNFQGAPTYDLSLYFDVVPQRSVALGQTLELSVTYGNGRAPFQILVRTSEGSSHVYHFSDPGATTFPIGFKSADTSTCHSVQITLIDANGVQKTIETAVIVQPAPPVVVTPKITNKPLPPITVVTPTITNQQLLTPMVGTYNAILDVREAILNAGGPFAKRSVLPKTPIQITFEPSGAVTGVCDYTIPNSGLDPKQLFDRVGWKTAFTINGSVDWTTGKINLTIPDGRIDYYRVTGKEQTDYVLEYAVTLRGRHLGDPFWSAYDRRNYLNINAPKIVAFTEAGELIGDDPTNENIWGHRMGTTPDPGVITKEIDWKKHFFILRSLNNLKIEEKLDTLREENTYSLKQGGGGWSLKILGPVTTAKDLASSELVGTSLWPVDSTTAKVGENVYSKFVGVFSNDYTKIRELNNVATWQVPQGLTQIRPGVFRADKPGKYDVSVKLKGKSGAWMEGFMTINVTGL